MESIRPHEYKLGDFFYIWGVSFGKESLGSLRAEGDNELNVYVNGKRVADPPNYVLQEGDVIAIGYGADDSFPHEPDDTALENVDKGQGSCGKGDAKGAHGCVDPDAETETDQEGSGA
jgi:hypothetical protein